MQAGCGAPRPCSAGFAVGLRPPSNPAARGGIIEDVCCFWQNRVFRRKTASGQKITKRGVRRGKVGWKALLHLGERRIDNGGHVGVQ